MVHVGVALRWLPQLADFVWNISRSFSLFDSKVFARVVRSFPILADKHSVPAEPSPRSMSHLVTVYPRNRPLVPASTAIRGSCLTDFIGNSMVGANGFSAKRSCVPHQSQCQDLGDLPSQTTMQVRSYQVIMVVQCTWCIPVAERSAWYLGQISTSWLLMFEKSYESNHAVGHQSLSFPQTRWNEWRPQLSILREHHVLDFQHRSIRAMSVGLRFVNRMASGYSERLTSNTNQMAFSPADVLMVPGSSRPEYARHLHLRNPVQEVDLHRASWLSQRLFPNVA